MPKRKSDRSGDARKINPPKKSKRYVDAAVGMEHPADLLLKLATDDNVETKDGFEVKVDDARTSSENALLTKNELQIYDDYKKEWTQALSRPQETLEVLARREQQIIEAAANHDWEALDSLQKEIESDLMRMQYVYQKMGLDLS
ncbi:MAG: hypothetical protein K2X93_27965 [Candidatus Obscuribacterales bacterium]|nr:hypothetical protein [Candidatus Obscuribacterales bacterium]